MSQSTAKNPKSKIGVSVEWQSTEKPDASVRFGKTEYFVSSDHFRRVSDKSDQRKLFKNSIKRVHAEVFAYCNRRCKFCPNVDGSRIKASGHLDEGVYLRILGDLRSIDYEQLFGFHQYNEPLADRVILDRIRQAREHLPKSHLATNSNGDYLDRPYLEELNAAGLNTLNVSIYGPRDGSYDRDYILDRMHKLAAKLNFDSPMDKRGERFEIVGECGQTVVKIIGRDIEAIGYNRGELLQVGPQARRSSPCFYPFEDLTIDWHGNVLPCCNVYPDASDHQQHVTGNLCDGRSIFEHYADSALVDWRRGLIRFYPGGKICEGCSRLDYAKLATAENVELLENTARKLSA